EQGVADVGVVGKDILLEYEPDVYEILDLKLGKCRVAVAAKNGYVEDTSRPLRVATKFTGIAKRYYALKGRDIELIKLNGSIELAPLLGMSDVIVDIVETGTTLRENDMSVIEEIAGVSARLIANKASYRFKQEEILKLKDVLSKEI
ncbi:MAG: ATP phosphoribosyltransferase, partial [Clostridiales bacterium]|nr:ATP phosphoribosyltransferase [Clostridiales bacterium]